MKKAILIVIVISLLSFTVLGAEPNESHIIENVKYYPMLEGYCAMTALRMNLNYYGLDIEQSLLLNLGWNYGFILLDSPYYTTAYACTDPVSEITYVSNILGFEATVLTHNSLDEAKKTLKEYVSQNIPVIVQWTPHTVLVYGYEDDGDRVIIYSPSLPLAKVIPKTKWTCNNYSLSDWLQAPYLWQYRKFQMVVVKPKIKEFKIDWKTIWKRASLKTLGTDTESYLNFCGIKGLQSLSQRIKSHFDQDTKKFRQTLHNFKMTFELGVGFRRNASSFLSGYAVALNDQNLAIAARHFRTSSHFFKKGQNLLKWSEKHPEKQAEVEKEIVEIIHNIIKEEKLAANFLLEASK
jgi:hypothetical protein